MVAVRRFALILLILLLLITVPAAGFVASGKTLRIGYPDHPGSALLTLAAVRGFFRSQGLHVSLVKFRDSKSGLAELEAGKLYAGAFAADETLERIAGGAKIRIISGGGMEQASDLIADLDDAALQEQAGKGILVVVADRPGSNDKTVQVKFVAALIQAYQLLQAQPESVWGQIEKKFSSSVGGIRSHFDPNPDYWRLERLWRYRGLQKEGMPRDFLAVRVNEEIYCDALDDLLEEDGRKDPVLLRLHSRAVCVPDCCPTKSQKTSNK